MANQKTSETSKKLFRAENDRIIGGVAGGLGHYFSVDPNIIRLLFILATVFGGGGVVVYLILWLIFPTQSGDKSPSSESIKNNAEEIKKTAREFGQNRHFGGIFLVVIGAIFLLQNLGLFGFWQFNQLWPLLLIALGLLIIYRRA